MFFITVHLCRGLASLKWIVNAKINILSPFTHPRHSKPVWVSFLCWTQNKIFWRTKQLLVPIDFSREINQWGPLTVWLPTFFKISSFMFKIINKLIKFRNNTRVSKWWQNYPFNIIAVTYNDIILVRFFWEGDFFASGMTSLQNPLHQAQGFQTSYKWKFLDSAGLAVIRSGFGWWNLTQLSKIMWLITVLSWFYRSGQFIFHVVPGRIGQLFSLNKWNQLFQNCILYLLGLSLCNIKISLMILIF